MKSLFLCLICYLLVGPSSAMSLFKKRKPKEEIPKSETLKLVWEQDLRQTITGMHLYEDILITIENFSTIKTYKLEKNKEPDFIFESKDSDNFYPEMTCEPYLFHAISGSMLLTSSPYGAISVFNIEESGEITLKLKAQPLEKPVATLIADNNLIFVAYQDNISIFSLNDDLKKPSARIKLDTVADILQLVLHQNLLMAFDGNSILIFELKENEICYIKKVECENTIAIPVADNNKLVVSANYGPPLCIVSKYYDKFPETSSFSLFDIHEDGHLHLRREYRNARMAYTFVLAAKGEFLFQAGDGDEVQVWQIGNVTGYDLIDLIHLPGKKRTTSIVCYKNNIIINDTKLFCLQFDPNGRCQQNE